MTEQQRIEAEALARSRAENQLYANKMPPIPTRWLPAQWPRLPTCGKAPTRWHGRRTTTNASYSTQ